MRTVLFFRDFRRFQGGHLKVRDYFNHVLAMDDWTARIAFSPASRWDDENPWSGAREYVVEQWQALHPDVFFVAGRDWLMLDRHPGVDDDLPVIHLVQDFYFADKENFRYQYLSRRAVRICSSEAVADALRQTGQANGPIHVIPHCIDLAQYDALPERERNVDLLIVAMKQAELGHELLDLLDDPQLHIDLITERVAQDDFRDRLRQSRVTLFLPARQEGFYLPGVEGMALGTLVVCPDCLGSRAYCRDGDNAFHPAYTRDELVRTAQAALHLPAWEATRMLRAGRKTVAEHSLRNERQTFQAMLQDIDRCWHD